MNHRTELAVRLAIWIVALTCHAVAGCSHTFVEPGDAALPPDVARADADTMTDRDPTTPDAAPPDAPDAPSRCAPTCRNCVDERCDDVAEVSVGWGHSCARMTDDTVRCWGYNHGLLSDNTVWERPAPVDLIDTMTGMPFTQVAEVVAGYWETCLRARTAGSGTRLRCWGPHGPLDIDTTTFTQLAVAYLHRCALTAESTVQCWGDNHAGQLGDGTTTDQPRPVTVLDHGAPLSGVAQVVVGGDLGASFSCARMTDDTVRCWGDNRFGQLGIGVADETPTPTPHPTPTPVPGLTGVAALSAGSDFVCARMRDGTVRCWGNRENGRLGLYPDPNPYAPRAVPTLTGVTQLVVGAAHACALTAGALQCWGSNAAGQLGDGTITTPAVRGARVRVALTDIERVSAGGYNTCAVRSDRTLHCWGANLDGEVADADTTVRHPTPVIAEGDAALDRVTAIAAGAQHACAVRARGAVCWGTHARFMVETIPFPWSPRAEAVPLGATHADEVAVGDNHACVLDADTHSVRCWGLNERKQLGDDGPDRVAPDATATALTGVERITAGATQTCARTTDDVVSCWGNGDNSRLGRGEEASPRAAPRPVTVTTTAGHGDVRTAFTRTCVVGGDGAARCFGSGSGVRAADPTMPTYTGVTQVAIGAQHSCAITTSGGVSCLGISADGRLGSPGGDEHDVARPIPGLAGVTALVSGVAHTCALRAGRVFCWGLNNFGQLGDGTLTSRETPAEVTGLDDVVGLAAGDEHTCALLRVGTVRCWGRNTMGQLGDGTAWYRATPSQVVFQ